MVTHSAKEYVRKGTDVHSNSGQMDAPLEENSTSEPF
jgi:hypothetical protein